MYSTYAFNVNAHMEINNPNLVHFPCNHTKFANFSSQKQCYHDVIIASFLVGHMTFYF